MDERRVGERHRIWAPVEIVSPGAEPAIAVTYDASDRGLLLLTRADVAIGAELVLTICLPDREAHRTRGRVVRVGRNDDDPEGLWPLRLAVCLDTPIPDFDAEIEPLSREHPLSQPK
jgi:PilZ domain